MKNMNTNQEPRRHVVTVLLHDYFHRHVFNGMIGEKQWSRFESRLERNVDDVCDLFDTFHIKATFFTLGWIAEVNPGVIQRIASKGHEIASAGYGIRTLGEMTRDQFRDDILRAQKALESAGANKIIGFRCSHKWLTEQNLWALEVLAEEGYVYDASYRTPLWSFGNHTPYRFVHKRQVNGKEIWEVPVSTYSIAGFSVPISGGNYLQAISPLAYDAGISELVSQNRIPFYYLFSPMGTGP